mmetsp:Transcript_4578/g.9933  ORF Transcript_4578/g.9933 Transcript_4578/m.9933 type:complete len:218 (+) Transcript_4578:2421-3074(+)
MLERCMNPGARLLVMFRIHQLQRSDARVVHPLQAPDPANDIVRNTLLAALTDQHHCLVFTWHLDCVPLVLFPLLTSRRASRPARAARISMDDLESIPVELSFVALHRPYRLPWLSKFHKPPPTPADAEEHFEALCGLRRDDESVCTRAQRRLTLLNDTRTTFAASKLAYHVQNQLIWQFVEAESAAALARRGCSAAPRVRARARRFDAAGKSRRPLE